MVDAEKVVRLARAWIGTPYHHQASVRGVGCDCLGLVRGVFREYHGLLHDPEVMPAYSPDWAESNKGREDMLDAATRHMEKIDGEPQLGDIVVFRFTPKSVAKHCAIMSYDGKMIHAHKRSTRVIEVHMVPWWRKRIAGVFRFQEA